MYSSTSVELIVDNFGKPSMILTGTLMNTMSLNLKYHIISL